MNQYRVSSRFLPTALIALLLSLLIASGAYAQSLSKNEALQTVEAVQHQWAKIKYTMPFDQQAEAFTALAAQTQTLVDAAPNLAEPHIWHAIVSSSLGGALGGLKAVTQALPLVKQARDELRLAEAINPQALNGSVYTSLGALYYQVPGWPIAFGDKAKAAEYLLKGYESEGSGLAAAYFYADFLIKQKEPALARSVLSKALQNPVNSKRPIEDAGRREEMRELLALTSTQ